MSSTDVIDQVTGPDEAARKRSRARLDGHWIVRTVNSRLFDGTRLGKCGSPRSSEVKVGRRGDGRAEIADIATCASPWACARCASVIRANRAEEIEHYARRHLEAGYCLLFLTLTIPHLRADDLFRLLLGLQNAWDAMTKGRPWRTLGEKFHLVGQIRSVEVTIGCNGWHPHLHVLLFLDTPPLDPEGDEVAELRHRITEMWGRMVARHLDGREINAAHAVDLVVVNGSVKATEEAIGRYLSKIHFELARSDLKTRRDDEKAGGGSRTPWQVAIDAYQTGDAADTARWQEYVAATKGRRVFSVSKAIRDRYGNARTSDASDDELAAEDQHMTPEVGIAADVWGTARHARTTGGRSVVAAALLAFEDGDPDTLCEVLAQHLGRPVLIQARPLDVPQIRFADSSSQPLEAGQRVYDPERFAGAAAGVRSQLRANHGNWGPRQPHSIRTRSTRP